MHHRHKAIKHLKHNIHFVLLGVSLIVIVSLFMGTTTTPAKASSGTVSQNYLKLPRTIHRHAERNICSIPAPNKARCLSEVSIGNNGAPITGTPATSGSFGPVEFHTAYNLPCTPGGSVASICTTPTTYGPQTIAIVDAGNFSTGTSGIESSLQSYDTYYGIPQCTIANSCLNVVSQTGSTSSLPADAGWSDEIMLDVESAHMICQTCKILLVEANDAYTSDLATANNEAASFNPVSISNSWSSSADQPSYDSSFNHPGIAEIASTGDTGTVSNGASWPSDSPNVIGASGTTLQIHNDNTWSSETVWSGSGGGCSNYYSAPSWQSSLAVWGSNGCGSYKAFGDISADADPNTGAAIYISGTWYEYGGTSLSSPLIASMFALSGGLTPGSSAANILYSSNKPSNFHDVTVGNDCVTGLTTHCTASTGFDTPSGLGTPNGIGGFSSTAPSQPTNLVATTIDQTHINLNWTASTASNGLSGYYIYRNNVKVATVATNSYNDSGLTPNTTYQYYIVAYDTLNNISVASTTINATASYPADINQDGHIDLLDLSILAGKWNQTGAGIGRADINKDGKVDLLDLSILAGQYGSE